MRGGKSPSPTIESYSHVHILFFSSIQENGIPRIFVVVASIGKKVPGIKKSRKERVGAIVDVSANRRGGEGPK
jgi:hypothetical protein